MQIPYTKREKLAGLFLLLGLGLLMTSALLVGGGRDWFRSYNNYYALYDQGYGLSPGVKVKFLRTDVGRVTALELTENNKVKVHISIQSEYASRVRTDSQAAIESPTLIGSEYIDIIPGTAAAGLVPQGGQIPARERKSLDDIIKELRLEEKLHQVEEIMANVASLTQQLQDPNGPLLGTMNNVKKLTATVAAGEGSIGGMVIKDELYNELIKIIQTLKDSIDNLEKTTADIRKASPTFPVVMDKVKAITSQVEAATRSAPEISRGAREGIKDVNDVLESAKRNILIRGNLPKGEKPDSLSYPARQEK